MPTSEILPALHELDEAPWADLNGKPLDNRRLAKELGRYGVKPMVFKDAANESRRGYVTFATVKPVEQVGLSDAWRRYLPPETRIPA